MSKENIIKMCSWGLASVVTLLAFGVWAGQRLGSGSLSAYDYFPLLGLLAFSLMWTHYIAGALRRRLGLEKSVNQVYMKSTSVIVLVLILLHPGLLNFQLNQDGFGVPPESYQAVYPQELLWVITLGLIGLAIFLLFELKRWLGKKPWWKFVEYMQIVAMGLIFYHGLALGRELSVGWYRAAWWLYGVTFVVAVLYNEWYDRQRNGGTHGTG